MRTDLVRSAVSFLNDPQVADATLVKRVEFLESKGLTSEEVEEALRLAKNPNLNNLDGSSDTAAAVGVPSLGSSSGPSSARSVPGSYSINNAPQLPPPLSLPPPIPRRDWKDYFVMATVSAGVAYGLYEVTRRYVLPLILPPTPSSLEADKTALEAEFARAEALLEQLHKDTEEIKESELQRKEQFATVLQDAQDAIESVKGQSQQIETDMKLIKSQVDSIKDSLPKALDKHRDLQDKALLDIQEELKSLKQLILNRIKNSSSPSGPPPASAVPSFIPPSSSSLSQQSPPSKVPSVFSASLPSSSSSSPSLTNAMSSSSPVPVPAPVQPKTSDQLSSSINSSSISNPTIAKPGIPAWQLAAAASKSTEPETATS